MLFHAHYTGKKFQRLTIASVDKDMQKMELSHTTAKNIVYPLWKIVCFLLSYEHTYHMTQKF